MKATDINLLEAAIADTERSPSYTLRWEGKIYTLPRAYLLLESQYKQLKNMKGTLIEAKRLVVEQSQKQPTKKFYINVDEKGICSIETKFKENSSVYCYRNGSQIAFDSNQKQKQDSQQTETIMATPAKAKSQTKETKISLVTVKGLTLNGKAVAIPEGRAKKWQSFLKKPNAKKDGLVTIKGLSFNKKSVFLPKGRATKWQSFLDKYVK